MAMQLDFSDGPETAAKAATRDKKANAPGGGVDDGAPESGPAEPVSLSDLETVDGGWGAAEAAREAARPMMFADEPTAPVSISDLETSVPDSAEPVSLRDLQMILAPGADPPSLRDVGKIDEPPPSEEVPADWVALSPPMAAPPKAMPPRPDRTATMPHAPAALAADGVPTPRDSSAADLHMMATLSVPPPPPRPAPPKAPAKQPAAKAPATKSPVPAPKPRLATETTPKPRAETEATPKPRAETEATPKPGPAARPAPPAEAAAAPSEHASAVEEQPPDSRMTDLRRMISLHPDFAPDSDRPPDSRRADLRELTKAREQAPSQKPPRPKKRERVADDDVLNLSGGIFGDAPLVPIAPPDLTAPLAPTESLPPISASVPTATTDEAKGAARKNKKGSGAQSPATPSAPSHPAATPEGSASRAGLWIALAAAAAAGWFFLTRKAPEPPATPETPATVRQEGRAAPSEPMGKPAPPSEEPSIDDPPVASASATAVATPVATAAPASTAAAIAKTPAPDDALAKTEAEGAKEPPSSEPAQLPAIDSPRPPAPPPAPSVTETPPAPAVPEFDPGAAKAALAAAAAAAAGCKADGDPSGVARVSVTFAPTGRVTSAVVNGPPFAGTPTGGCIATRMRSAKVPPFEGSPVTVHKTVSIP